MTAYVIDTNVAVVANGRAEQASPKCVLNCITQLREVQLQGRVVLDDGMQILREYMNNLSMSGEKGAGDYFMKWVWQNQAVPERCERVKLTPRSGTSDDFAEFPVDTRLGGFDRSDRKFVAVALASPSDPIVLNATDSDWWEYRELLAGHRIRIRFLCPDFFNDRQ